MPGIVILCGLHTSCYLPITIKSCGITISILQMMKQRFGEFKVLAHVLIPIRQNYDSPLGMTGFGAQVLTHHCYIHIWDGAQRAERRRMTDSNCFGPNFKEMKTQRWERARPGKTQWPSCAGQDEARGQDRERGEYSSRGWPPSLKYQTEDCELNLAATLVASPYQRSIMMEELLWENYSSAANVCGM